MGSQIIDTHNLGMVQIGDNPALIEEAHHKIPLVGQSGSQDLEGNLTSEGLLLGQKYTGHGAFADFTINFITWDIHRYFSAWDQCDGKHSACPDSFY